MDEINSTTQTYDFDLSLDKASKKRIRIDNDDNRILLLDTSDLSVIIRLQDIYPKLQSLAGDASREKLASGNEEDVSNALKELDADMRGLIDYIFDTEASKVCAPSGTMFDMFNGQFRFEIIIEALSKLYTDNVSLEYRKMKSRLEKKVSKYTGK